MGKLRFGSICLLFFAALMFFSVADSHAQIYRKKKNRGGSSKGGKIEFKKNIIWLEGLGSNQVVGAKYERIFMFGSVVSMRFDLGITPFVVDEQYNFIAGRSITPITGMGFYFHIVPFPVKIGVGCSVLHDIYFDGIPEVIADTSGKYTRQSYRARVMPWALVEVTIKERWTIRAGYTPIIDPPNEMQTDLYFTNWGTIGVGYKFGR